MAESAYEWGLRHRSCRNGLEARKALGPNATQADWWKICDRGDWLIWQLERLPPDQFESIRPKLMRAIEVIVTSAIVEHALDCGIREVELWAARWLSGEDRSAESAFAAAEAWADAADAARADAADAARAAELRMQADDIRTEIPEWPG